MPDPTRYYFGRSLARQLDLFAFPRTGSHFLRYCTVGLFDLVTLPPKAIDNPEAIDRQQELDPDVLYALELREDGVPYQPVIIHTTATGRHGEPVDQQRPAVILTREPIATVYSGWRAAKDRPGFQPIAIPHHQWIQGRFDLYHAWLSKAADLLAAKPADTLAIRYDELVASPEPLQRLADLLQVRPKLRPALVHKLTRFDLITRPGHRTFYRAADDLAWRNDADFTQHLVRVNIPDFSRFCFVQPSPAMPSSASTSVQ